MQAPPVSPARWIGAIMLGAYPFVMHATYVWSQSSTTGKRLIWAELAILAMVLIVRFPRWRVAAILAVGAGALILAVRSTTSDAIIVASGVPYTATYIGLLAIFGASLLPGRTPVITLLSEKLSVEPLSPPLLSYTRKVTILWSCFFATQLIISFALFFGAATITWSFFVNVLNIPLNNAVFAGEYAYRRLRFPSVRHRAFAEIFRTLTDWKGLDLRTNHRGSKPP
jgi:uncharacterized membrane protein